MSGQRLELQKRCFTCQIGLRAPHDKLKVKARRPFRERWRKCWLVGSPVRHRVWNLLAYPLFAIFLVSGALALDGELGKYGSARHGANGVSGAGRRVRSRACGWAAHGEEPLDSARECLPGVCGNVVYVRV